MPTAEFPVPYPRTEHEAHVLMTIYALLWGSWFLGLIVQSLRAGDVRWILARARYLVWRIWARRKDEN